LIGSRGVVWLGVSSLLAFAQVAAAEPQVPAAQRLAVAESPPGQTAELPAVGAGTPAPPVGLAPTADQGASAGADGGGDAGDDKLPFRSTTLEWEHSVTTQTLGVGSDVQSRNPTYDTTLLFRPRWYVVDRPDYQAVAAAELSVTRELTNSDATTKSGETDFPDAILFLMHGAEVHKSGDYVTRLDFLVPELILPTSTVSRSNGTIMRLGVGALPRQQLPLFGSESDYFKTLLLQPRLRYRYLFSTAEVPTSADLAAQEGRIRTDIDGRPIVSDQLGGAAFAQHQLRAGLDTVVQATKAISLATRFEWWWSFKYAIDQDAMVCDPSFGCTQPSGVDDPEILAVNTVFLFDVSAQLMDELSASVTYANLANQIGGDGQRRNMLWSPDARFLATLILHVDALAR
jgi:hypothetical protein